MGSPGVKSLASKLSNPEIRHSRCCLPAHESVPELLAEGIEFDARWLEFCHYQGYLPDGLVCLPIAYDAWAKTKSFPECFYEDFSIWLEHRTSGQWLVSAHVWQARDNQAAKIIHLVLDEGMATSSAGLLNRIEVIFDSISRSPSIRSLKEAPKIVVFILSQRDCLSRNPNTFKSFSPIVSGMADSQAIPNYPGLIRLRTFDAHSSAPGTRSHLALSKSSTSLLDRLGRIVVGSSDLKLWIDRHPSSINPSHLQMTYGDLCSVIVRVVEILESICETTFTLAWTLCFDQDMLPGIRIIGIHPSNLPSEKLTEFKRIEDTWLGNTLLSSVENQGYSIQDHTRPIESHLIATKTFTRDELIASRPYRMIGRNLFIASPKGPLKARTVIHEPKGRDTWTLWARAYFLRKRMERNLLLLEDAGRTGSGSEASFISEVWTYAHQADALLRRAASLFFELSVHAQTKHDDSRNGIEEPLFFYHPERTWTELLFAGLIAGEPASFIEEALRLTFPQQFPEAPHRKILVEMGKLLHLTECFKVQIVSQCRTASGAQIEDTKNSDLIETQNYAPTSFMLSDLQTHLPPFQLLQPKHKDSLSFGIEDRGHFFQRPAAGFGEPFSFDATELGFSNRPVLCENVEELATFMSTNSRSQFGPVFLRSTRLSHPLIWRLYLEEKTILAGLEIPLLQNLLSTPLKGDILACTAQSLQYLPSASERTNPLVRFTVEKELR